MRIFFHLALIFSAMASPKPLLGCINDYVPNTTEIASQALVDNLVNVNLIEPWTTRRDRLRKEVESGGDYKTRNDLASALMHTADPETAILILMEIERTNPGLYQTASNLGTAFELAGDNARALDWIRIGIQRNPESHQGSEWLHVKILEAKIGEKELTISREPNWTNTGSLLGFDFEKGVPKILPMDNNGKPLTLAQIEGGLKYQLRERMQFVKPKNQLVASLLSDLGSIIELNDGPGIAKGIYELAAQYAETDSPSQIAILHRAIHATRRAEHAARAIQNFSILKNPVFFIGSLSIFGLIAIYITCRIWVSRQRQFVGSKNAH